VAEAKGERVGVADADVQHWLNDVGSANQVVEHRDGAKVKEVDGSGADLKG